MTESVEYYNTNVHRKVIELFRGGMFQKDITEKLGLKSKTVSDWIIGRDKHIRQHRASRQKMLRKRKRESDMTMKTRPRNQRKPHPKKRQLLKDYSTGKYSLSELARIHQITRQTATKWKKSVFGDVPIRKKRMYQMKKGGVPLSLISEIYGIGTIGVCKAIRGYESFIQNTPEKPI